jgi:hypothetical protein
MKDERQVTHGVEQANDLLAMRENPVSGLAAAPNLNSVMPTDLYNWKQLVRRCQDPLNSEKAIASHPLSCRKEDSDSNSSLLLAESPGGLPKLLAT